MILSQSSTLKWTRGAWQCSNFKVTPAQVILLSIFYAEILHFQPSSISKWKNAGLPFLIGVTCVWHQSQPSFGLKSFEKIRVFEVFVGSFFPDITLDQTWFLYKQPADCMQYNVTRIKEFDNIHFFFFFFFFFFCIERKFKKCIKFRTWNSLLAIILLCCTGLIYCKLGHIFLSFSSCYYCTFDNLYFCWLFRDHFKRCL